MHQKKVYSEEQLRYIYRQYLLEQAKVVHRIFDNVIGFTRRFLGNAIVADNYPDGDFFTGYVYDSNNFICKLGDKNSHHPIYIRFDNEPEQTYEAYIPVRKVNGKSLSELQHDPIVIHLNVPVIRFNANYEAKTIRHRIPSLIAHELTHAKDMWTSDYVNTIENLIDLGYGEVNKEFLEKEAGITGVSDADIQTVNGMLYFMSPAETSAIYEGYDKYLKYLTDGQILQYIGDQIDTDLKPKREIAAQLFAATKVLARINNRMMYLRLEDFVKSNDFAVPVLFTAYAVYSGFIPDSSGYFEDFSIAKDVIEGRLFPDVNMTKMMVNAFTELEIKFGEYVADIEDLIIEVLDERGIFDKVKTRLEEHTSSMPGEWYDEKLSVYGQLTELESPFQMFMMKLTDLAVPNSTLILESEYRNKEITLREMIGHI